MMGSIFRLEEADPEIVLLLFLSSVPLYQRNPEEEMSRRCCHGLQCTQSWKMSNLLHGPINKPDFTPRKAHKSRHLWHFKPTKQNLLGFLWWINVDKLSIYGSLFIDLKFFANIFPKMAFLLIFLASQTFYPNWPIFLHGYIRHIRDIFQLCICH